MMQNAAGYSALMIGSFLGYTTVVSMLLESGRHQANPFNHITLANLSGSTAKDIAQAQAEIRRAAAVAQEQEMKAKVEEMNAKLVEAQSQVPMAIAEAFRAGNLGIMDYYRLENIQSDTSMRKSISDTDSDSSGPPTT